MDLFRLKRNDINKRIATLEMDTFVLAIIVILANLFNVKVASQCVSYNVPKTSYNKLLRDIFCEYNSDVVPVRSSITVMKININIIPAYFLIAEEYKTMGLFGSMDMTWLDQYLKWKPEQYNNITFVQSNNFDVWEPDLVSHRGSMGQYYFGITDTFIDKHVTIFNNGTVKYNSKFRLNGHCTTQLQDWPLDLMQCTIMVGITELNAAHIRMNYVNRKLNLDRFFYEDEKWMVSKIDDPSVPQSCVRSKQRCPVVYSFSFKRKSSVYLSTLLFPQICISILLLSTFFMFKGTHYRLALFITVLSSQIMYLVWIVSVLSITESYESVRLFNFYVAISWVSIFGIILTLINRYTLSDQNQSLPPYFVMDIIDYLFENKYAKKLNNVRMMNSEEVVIVTDVNPENRQGNFESKSFTYKYWKRLAKLCNAILFMVALLFILAHFIIIWINFLK